jgi:hypothetical protein
MEIEGMHQNDLFSHVGSMADRGYSVLRKIVDNNSVQKTYVDLSDEYRNTESLPWRGGGKWIGHLNLLPSVTSQAFVKLLNSYRLKDELIKLLGPDFAIIHMYCNANLPASNFQPVHVDGLLDENTVIVSLPIGDVNVNNGSIKIWPNANPQPPIPDYQALKKETPLRLNTASGDVILRYGNRYHQGTPNRSANIRFMLGLHARRRSCKDFPQMAVTQSEFDILSKCLIPVNARVVKCSVRGYAPNYFKPTVVGNAKELLWMYAPSLFEWLKKKDWA